MKVVLIDDEETIIEGLKVLIDWNLLGFEIAGEAYDGEEGIEVVKRVMPDIIITDIRMPIISGLDMIGLAKEFLPYTKIMILSGYSDFDYARQAIEKGASFYLLKPVSRDELVEKLTKAREEVLQAMFKAQQEKKIAINLYNMQNAAKEKYLKDMAEGKIASLHEMERIWSLFEFGRIPVNLCVVIFEIDDFSVVGFDKSSDRSTLKFAVDNIVEELVLKTNAGVFFSYDGEKSVLIFCAREKRNIKKEVLDVIKEVKETVFDFLKVTLSVGIGSSYPGMGELAQSYSEACYALEKKFLYGKNVTLCIDDVMDKDGDIEFKPVPLERELVMHVESCDKEEAINLLDKLFHYLIRESGNSPSQIYAECVNVLAVLRQSLYESTINHSDIFKEEYFSLQFFKRFKTYPELQGWMKELILLLIDKTTNQPISHTEQLVEKIKKFINNNFIEATRESVASKFFINPSYLSQIFKQSTGCSFTDYLTAVRMERAKKILVSSDMKVKNIAETLGYNSSQYFAKVFEKYVGSTPLDYRKNSVIARKK